MLRKRSKVWKDLSQCSCCTPSFSILCMPIAFSYLSCRSRWALLVIYCLSLTYTLCTWASGVDHFLCCYPLHQSMILKAFLVFMEALGQEIISCPSLNDIDFCLISMKYSRTKNAFCLSSSKDSFYFYTFFFLEVMDFAWALGRKFFSLLRSLESLLHMRKWFREVYSVSCLSSHSRAINSFLHACIIESGPLVLLIYPQFLLGAPSEDS